MYIVTSQTGFTEEEVLCKYSDGGHNFSSWMHRRFWGFSGSYLLAQFEKRRALLIWAHMSECSCKGTHVHEQCGVNKEFLSTPKDGEFVLCYT